jgi:two-component system sensor histidine kinase/response regulator
MPREAKTVLIVDDDTDVRTMIAECLRNEGWAILEAKNGLEALLNVKHERPAAVVLDLEMPRLGGLEAMKRIRAFAPAIRVVVVTGHAEKYRQPALALGAVAVLTKPIALPELLAALGGPPSTPRSAPSAAAPSPATPAEAQPRTRDRGRILIVDDEPDWCAMLGEFLGGLGYQTESVSDGLTAVRCVTENPPDLVLLDIEMPGLNGLEALKRFRRVSQRVKIIMVSGSKSAETAARTLVEGAFDYVVKPVDFDQLARSIETALLMRQLEA